MQKPERAHNHTHIPVNLPPGVRGLTAKEAEHRLQTFGPNEVLAKKRRFIVAEFLFRFKNPLIFILIIAALISAFFGDAIESSIIVAIVLASVTLDFINTYKSQRAAEALQERVRITATAVRDGHVSEIVLSHIVPDDVVLLSPGDIIPADGAIIHAKDFFVNESSLTGESFPVEKVPTAEVFMGSSVVTGNAIMKVSVTGVKTRFGDIAKALAKREEPTDFDRGIKDFSFLIMRITFGLVVFVFFINALGKHNVLESFLFAAALAVGLTPELLPMIISLNLSRGSLAMSKRGVIVKKLSAIQNFGGMEILCTDKTGTLTEDRIVLVKHVDSFGNDSDSVFLYSYINSTYQSGFANPLDAAVIEYKKLDVSQYLKVDEIPFDYLRKRNSVIVDLGNDRMLISKGAPEELLGVSTSYGDTSMTLTPDIIKKIHNEYDRLSADGFRVLGIAIKKLSERKEVYERDAEQGMIFLGFIGFLDPPKETAGETLRILKEHGIEIKIITGDNALVTQKIARDLALPVKGVLTGPAIAEMNDDALRIQAETTTIFARVSPDQKTRIIRLLQKNQHVVGYLGDGINDAPSLKAADVGISVNNAVDVAKESADLILIHKSLRELVDGVIEGRKTFVNTMKYLMMALSSNFGNMFSMAGASLFIPFLPMLPVQILLNNLLYDGSQFALPLDAVDPEDIKQPRKWDIGFMKRFMIIFGPTSSLFDFITFVVLLYGFHLYDHAFQTGWFLESIATQTFVVYIIRTRKFSFVQSAPGRVLFLSTMAAVIIAWGLSFSPFGPYLQLSKLSLGPIGAILAIVAGYLVTVEIVKHWFYGSYLAKRA